MNDWDRIAMILSQLEAIEYERKLFLKTRERHGWDVAHWQKQVRQDQLALRRVAAAHKGWVTKRAKLATLKVAA